MKIWLPWFSRTGTTRAVAEAAAARLEAGGHRVTSWEIRPRTNLPYPAWLALSFVPGSVAELGAHPPDPTGFDGCLLAVPKWTFSCPPVNGFLAATAGRLPPTAVIVICGGWDEERYLDALLQGIRRSRSKTLGGLTLRRRSVERGRARLLLAPYLDRCFPPSRHIEFREDAVNP